MRPWVARVARPERVARVARPERVARPARVARLVTVVGAVVALGATPGCSAAPTPAAAPNGTTSPAPTPSGNTQVLAVDEQGVPIPAASITAGPTSVVTGPDGLAWLDLTSPTLVAATAPEHLSRVQAVEPGGAARIELTRRTPTTVSLRFGGDTMFGRRFYESEDAHRPLLTSASTAADHAALLAAVEPLLDDADLTVVNLETTLIADPYWAPDLPRPARMHPTKALVFASALATAEALRSSGIDAVSLGNNHTFDGLDAGLASTVAALDAAGVVHFGAGANEDEAWRPAIVTRAGQRIALIGCTTVTGDGEPVPYVAGPSRAGAAACSSARLAATVAQARKASEAVVVMIHGAVEYQRQQTSWIRSLMHTAATSGAALVVTGHPHVIGGLTRDGTTMLAESTGNLAFDQDLWPTFPSYLLRADLTAGVAVNLTADPLMLDHYQPRPVTGEVAQAVARIAAGVVPGPARLIGPGTYVAGAGADGMGDALTSTMTTLDADVVRTVGPGWWISDSAAPVDVGTDLLYGSGSFDPVDTDPRTPAGRSWDLGLFASIGSDAACGPTGPTSVGLQLVRSPMSAKDLIAAPEHRLPVTPGDRLSLVFDVRSSSAGVAELRWYAGNEGSSSATLTTPIPSDHRGPADCRQVRIDATVPDGVFAASPYLRLEPAHDTQLATHLFVDNVRLIQWAPPGATGRIFDTLASPADAQVGFTYDPPPIGGLPRPAPLLPATGGP